MQSEGFRLFDGGDPSKKVKFDLSKITPKTTRTIEVPDKDGIVVLQGDSVSFVEMDVSGITQLRGDVSIEGDVTLAKGIQPSVDDSQDIGVVVPGAKILKDHYNNGDDSQALMSAPNLWFAQSFTAQENCDVTSVMLKMFTEPGVTGNITVSIRDASGDDPIGNDLVSGTIDISNLDTSLPGSFIECTFNAPCSLTAGSQYAIVVRDDTSANVYWRCDVTSPTYAGGSLRLSSNDGSTWTMYGGGFDAMFELYSESLPEVKRIRNLFLSGQISDGENSWSISDVQEMLDWYNSQHG